MTKERKAKSDLEEDLVEIIPPISDCELFARALVGNWNVEPVKIPREEMRNIRRVARIFLVTYLLGTGVYGGCYARKEYGSIREAYNAFMEKLDRGPPRMWNP